MKSLWMIKAKHFVAGLEVNKNGYVDNCAPILHKWCHNRHILDVIESCKQRRLDIEEITKAEKDLVSELFYIE